MPEESTAKSRVSLRSGHTFEASETPYRIWDKYMLAADAREFSKFTFIPTPEGGAIVRLDDIDSVSAIDD